MSVKLTEKYYVTCLSYLGIIVSLLRRRKSV